MKNKKIISFVSIFIFILLFSSSGVYAIKAPDVYVPVVSSASIIMAGIMKLLSIITIIAHIIFVIVYSIKSKKDKKTKIKTIVIWLIISVILVIALHFGSIAVIESDFLG